MARPPITAGAPCPRRGAAAFTLVEILVVIGIIAVLVGALLTGLGVARAEARRVGCMANLSQIGKLAATYASDRGGRVVPYYGRDHESLDPGDATPTDAWFVELLSIAVGQPDKGQINLANPPGEADIFLCPEDTRFLFNRDNLSYGINADVMDGDGNPYTSATAAADGQANAYYFDDIANPAEFILIADSGYDPTQPITHRNMRSWITSPKFINGRAASGMHRGRANILYGDLHVDSAEARAGIGINAPTPGGARPWTLGYR